MKKTLVTMTILTILLITLLPACAESASSLYDKGNKYFDEGDYEAAIKYYDKAIALDACYTNAWYNKGISLYQLTKYEESITCFDKVLELEPDASDAKQMKEKILKAIQVSNNNNNTFITETANKPDMVLIQGSPSGDFYMGKYEVTNKEYCQYNSTHKGDWSDSDCPVETVSWYDAINYCNWRSDKDGLTRCYSGSEDNITVDINKNGYRLPTEAEWVYACKAGSTTDYYWGENMRNYSCPSIDDYCWYKKNSGNHVNPVGQKKPNAWGLYDMIGNVFEWCECYDKSSSRQAFRGGCWQSEANYCKSDYNACCFEEPYFSTYYLGFRLVRNKPLNR